MKRKYPPRIMYIEQKTWVSVLEAYGSHKPSAFIGRVTFSRSGKTIYYKDKAFVRLYKGGISGNHAGYDREAYEAWQNSGETGFIPGYLGEFWISGPKKNGKDSHYEVVPKIYIDEDVREEYWRDIRNKPENIDRPIS